MTTATILKESTLTVHFWNLAAYVNGRLVGDWVDLDACADYDEFTQQVDKVTLNAEEVMVSEQESDFGIKIPQFMSLADIWYAHQMLSEIGENNREAFGDYLAYYGGLDYLDQAMRDFDDHYCGRWDSIEDYAWDYAEDAYPDLAKVPPGFRVEIDTVAWECDHWRSDNGHVFSS
ncbi:antirestriction protein ArdA [Nonomuraea sp. NPDC049129]|uniref:antirestriction protein ArdA n=1 Tax=Nonomuraea sp. NPDC049129 TaxID=3155272 RepID=UPI0034109E88